VAPKHFVTGLMAALVLAACSGEPDAEAGPDIAALRARNDSIRQARAAAPAAATAAAETAAPRESSAAARTPLAADSGAAGDTAAGRPREAEIQRETFVYSGGTRDPFASLVNQKSSGPEIVDLQVVGIYQNLEAPAQSIAVIREKGSSKRHKLRVGDQIGRLRVARVGARDVVFSVLDFGYERQETLSLRKQEDDTP
jgi:hypothetical protein